MTPREAWRAGFREAIGAPSWLLGIGFIGFGSLAQSLDFSLLHAALSTVTIWALPGQLLLVEMHTVGAPFVAILLAVTFSSSRFLPLAVTLMPHLRVPGVPAWRYYAAGQVLAMTSWAVAMRRFPTQERPERLPFFLGFALTMWIVALLCTIAGYALAGSLPGPVRLAFIFANPLYFVLILTADLRGRMVPLALALGAVAGPLVHPFMPAWSVIFGGLAGGTAAFFLTRDRHD
ncbi:MAG: AzlC family ABC transporter permease [Betaproteobacteria bacterium]|nr:AzlC family ABC transporter permease [Betaproteobacteria bacterium]